MKIRSQVLIAASFLLMMACSDDKKSTATAPTTTTAPQTEAHSADDGHGHTELQTLPQTESAAPAPASSTPATNVALNPPHGQPGHRCDIQVGEPLSSAPAPQPSAVQQAPTQAPTVNNTTVPTLNLPAAGSQTGTVAAGMNPPHGQPGHDCAVAVGAPLPKK